MHPSEKVGFDIPLPASQGHSSQADPLDWPGLQGAQRRGLARREGNQVGRAALEAIAGAETRGRQAGARHGSQGPAPGAFQILSGEQIADRPKLKVRAQIIDVPLGMAMSADAASQARATSGRGALRHSRSVSAHTRCASWQRGATPSRRRAARARPQARTGSSRRSASRALCLDALADRRLWRGRVPPYATASPSETFSTGPQARTLLPVVSP